jgi:ATP-dependent protease HslVU (ClpYQ) ATPase subunit|tara:strand:+ start:448 stop:735 length:288 start_codon:yes stop_codon:yes gene_type:complete
MVMEELEMFFKQMIHNAVKTEIDRQVKEAKLVIASECKDRVVESDEKIDKSIDRIKDKAINDIDEAKEDAIVEIENNDVMEKLNEVARWIEECPA